jgi:prolipoprotein diacylglyceryltransferase
MGGCCHGAYLGKDYVFGGIWMETNKGTGYFVPTQLYEALFLFALFAVLSVLYFKRCNFTMATYLIAYAVWRMFIEFFRTDERGAIILGLAPSQWQSVVFLVLGVGLIAFYYFKKIPFFLPKDKPGEKE